MRKSVNGEIYSEENEHLSDLAVSLGWMVDDTLLYHSGLRFKKGATHIWKCVSFKHGGIVWQVADLIGGKYCNHRPERNIEDALRDN